MGSFLNFSGIFFKEFDQVFFDFAYLLYGTLSLIISSAVVFLLTIFYKRIRKYPVKVNCWFCNSNTTVSYDLVNSWDCPHCKQYNGFNKDGSYNRIIEEQYNPKLNKDVFNTLKPNGLNSKSSSESNGLCKLCNINQQLKIQQLALFTPLDENNYYEEVEKYREKLEKAYSLCTKCEGVLKETLEKQEYTLLQNRLNNHKQSFSSQQVKSLKELGKKNLVKIIYKTGVNKLSWICLIIALLQFFALIVKFTIEQQIISNVPLPEFEISKFALKNLKYYTFELYKYNKELSFAAFVCCLLACTLVKRNQNSILVWGLLHLSFWSTLTGVQMVLSGLSVFMSAKAVQKQLIVMNKKSLHKKASFQPKKEVFPDVCNISSRSPEKDLFASMNSETFRSSNPNLDCKENVTCQSENIKVIKNSDVEKPMRKSKKQDNEEEYVLNQEKADHSAESTNEVNTHLSSSLLNNSFLGSGEQKKNEAEMTGSFNEVYNGLTSLHLGGKQKKSSKSSNFLFSSPDFTQTKNSPIIKPAKFIKNLNSTSWSESNDYNSRSSTPSSQKTEKPDSNRYDCFKPMTPISINAFNKHSPMNFWDYDSSNGLYNNFGYFPPGFLPFQQFSSPVGHTTIYTSSRPTSFSFPFTPWPGFANPKFSPTSRFSDSSDCDNLFQNTSKNFEKDKKWFKLKKFSYYFSLLLNIFTIFGLFYFISTGIILVDWKLPTLNFFQ